MSHRECTAEEGQRWHRDYSDGYVTGRGDGRYGRPPRIELIEIPADVPGETGASYVARHLSIAWQIGYTGAYLFERKNKVMLITSPARTY